MGDTVIEVHPLLAIVALIVTLLLVPIVKLVNGWWSKGAAEQSAEAAQAAAEAAQQSARTADWESYAVRIESLIEKQDERLDKQGREIHELRSKVEHLECVLATFRRKYKVAVRHIARLIELLKLHVPVEQIPQLPAEIFEDFEFDPEGEPS